MRVLKGEEEEEGTKFGSPSRMPDSGEEEGREGDEYFQLTSNHSRLHYLLPIKVLEPTNQE